MFNYNKSNRYRLKVTAGTDYNPDTHEIVNVNTDQTLRIENEHATVSLCVRIRDYSGYPDNSPSTNPYFSHHLHVEDQYSISFSIIFKHPVNGNDLLFGNDFDRPIRDRLPPGFNAAFRFVKWAIDPAMEGDAYADKPFIFSPALASWNQFCIGEKIQKTTEVRTAHNEIVQEGAEGSGAEVRSKYAIPGTAEERQKFFQNEAERKKFEFEAVRMYWVDFGNPYLNFNDFSLALPGFNFHVAKYVDEKNHHLRYVLKNRDSDVVYLVVLFTLVLLGTDEEPQLKERTEQESQDSKKEYERNGGKLGRFEWEPKPSTSDVD